MAENKDMEMTLYEVTAGDYGKAFHPPFRVYVPNWLDKEEMNDTCDYFAAKFLLDGRYNSVGFGPSKVNRSRPSTQYERLEINRLGFVNFYIKQKLRREGEIVNW